jgi:hypothetical protein
VKDKRIPRVERTIAWASIAGSGVAGEKRRL